MNEDPTKTGLDGLQALISRAAQDKSSRAVAPVELWEPEYCGELDMEIRPDGTWFYMGSPIGRHALVKLFSTVLRKDKDGETYLVTPVEKIRIKVIDAPFLAVEMNASEVNSQQVLTFRTNVGDIVEASEANPIRFVVVEENDGIKPYLLVRGRLEALLARSVMYDLIAHGGVKSVDGVEMFCVESHGCIFAIMSAKELEKLSN